MSRAFRKYFLILLAITHSAQSTKWLIDSPGFNDPLSWEDEYLPCAKDNVIFPKAYQALLPLPKNVDVAGIILPKDGAILLQQESTIIMGGDSRERVCDKGKAYLKEPTVRKWFDPNIWRSRKEQQENSAVPDMERVPCNNESIVIQNNGPLALDLEFIPYLRLGQLSFAGSLISKAYLKELLYTDVGQYLFKNQEGVSVEYYHNDVCGCHKDFNTFQEPICHNINDACPKPHCLVSIVPYGSCCAICGSILRFSVEYCDNEKISLLKEVIRKELMENSLKEDLDFYVNYVNSNAYGNYLQAIAVDRDSYSEKSVKFMKYLNETTNWIKKLKLESNNIYRFEFSGRPYNPNVTFGSILMILLCFIFVMIVALVIFAHYKPDNHYLHYIPRWVYDPRLWRTFVNRSNNVFARFDNTRASIQTISAEGHAKRAFTIGYDPESDKVREQAFDNPMFDEVTASTSHAAHKEEQKYMKKEDKQEVPQLLIESIDDVSNGEEEEQELTQIKLESSSDEGAEQETQE